MLSNSAGHYLKTVCYYSGSLSSASAVSSCINKNMGAYTHDPITSAQVLSIMHGPPNDIVWNAPDANGCNYYANGPNAEAYTEGYGCNQVGTAYQCEYVDPLASI